MAKCSFCGNEIEKGTGMMFVQKIGKVLHFCTSKCENNFELGRKHKHTRWTQEFRKLKGKLAADVEKEELKREAESTALGGKPKVRIGGAAAKKLKGGA